VVTIGVNRTIYSARIRMTSRASVMLPSVLYSTTNQRVGRSRLVGLRRAKNSVCKRGFRDVSE